MVLHLARKSLDELLKRRSAGIEQEKLLDLIDEMARSNAQGNKEKIDQVCAQLRFLAAPLSSRLKGDILHSKRLRFQLVDAGRRKFIYCSNLSKTEEL